MHKLLRWFCAFKAVNIAILLSASAFYPFDNSTSLLRSKRNILTRLLEPFIRWDAVYYFLIAKNGYIHEKMHAFYPLYPFLIRLIASLLPITNDEVRLALSGIIISNLAHLTAYLSLFYLTLFLFQDEEMAYGSALFFLIQPASYHMTTLFSEGPFAALAITGMLCFVKGLDSTAALLLFLASLVRSNGVLLSGFFLYRSVFMFRSIKCFGKDVILSLVSASGGLLYLFSCYRKYCLRAETEKIAEWCFDKIPNIYSYLQTKYWNVGAFKYYTLTQLPNFVIALPMITLSFHGLMSNKNVLLFQSKQTQIVPFYYLWVTLFVFSLVFVHIQVINRLFSFLPPVFWLMSRFYETSNYTQKRLMLFVIGVYYASISFMIACFYPPA